MKVKSFSEKEMKLVEQVLKSYIKENGDIKDSSKIIEALKNSSDFTQKQYKTVNKIINEYLRYEDTIKDSNIKSIIKNISNAEETQMKTITKIIIVVAFIAIIIVSYVLINTNSARRSSNNIQLNNYKTSVIMALSMYDANIEYEVTNETIKNEIYLTFRGKDKYTLWTYDSPLVQICIDKKTMNIKSIEGDSLLEKVVREKLY